MLKNFASAGRSQPERLWGLAAAMPFAASFQRAETAK